MRTVDENHNMKRTTRQKPKRLARLEHFEPRLCMASDLNDLAALSDILEINQAVEYSDFSIVDRYEGISDQDTSPSNDAEKEDGLKEQIAILDGDDTHQPSVDWVPGIVTDDPKPDDFDDDGSMDSDDSISHSPIDSDPIDSDPGEEPLGPSMESQEGRAGGNDPKPNPIPNPDPRGHNTPSHGVVDPQSLPSAKKSPWEVTSYVAESRLAPSAILPTERTSPVLSPLSSQMGRFSSIDIAVTTLQDAPTELGAVADTLAVLPRASSDRSWFDPPQYFASDLQTIAAVAFLRESFSEQTILHKTEKETVRVVQKEAWGVVVDPTLERPWSIDVAGESAAILIRRIFGFEMVQAHRKPLPQVDLAPEHPSEESPEPSPAPKHGSIHRVVGFILAGALISVQETSRIFRNRNNEEKTLHRTRISTLKSSSNS
jgi:hypothetical protein